MITDPNLDFIKTNNSATGVYCHNIFFIFTSQDIKPVNIQSQS